jgi:hypothetical protein
MDRAGRLHAQKNFVGMVIVFAEVVRIVRGHERNVQLFLQAKHVVLDLLIELQPVILQLKKKVAMPEDVSILNRGTLRALVVVFHQVLRQLARQAAGKTDEPLRMLGEILLRDTRLAIEAVQRGFRRDADEVAVSFFVFRKHQQVVVIIALRVGTVVFLLTHIQLAAENRLDALLLRSLKKMHSAVNISVVGDRDRGLADVLNALDELVDVAGAIEEREVGVEMQMCELSHGDLSILFPGERGKTGEEAAQSGGRI